VQRATGSVKPIILLALGFLVLVMSVLSALWLSVLQEQAAGWVRHTLEVENRLNQVGRLVTQAETGQRGFLLTGDQSYLTPYRQGIRQLPVALDDLSASTRDNPAQLHEMQQLRALMKERITVLRQGVELAEQGKNAAGINVVRDGAGKRYMDQISVVLGRMFAIEEQLLAERSAIAEWRTRAARIILALSTLFVILFGILALIDAKRRLDALRSTVDSLNEEALARGQAQSQVHQLQKMEAVGQLTGGVAHDFNNMLAIIVGSLDLARSRLKKSDHESVARYIDQAQEGAGRAASLTAQLLAFARRQPLEPRVLEPNRLVGDISELLRRTLGETIQIETVLAGGLWTVHADPEQLESALVNLAVNARDAMPTGGKLTIETANSELDERYARQHEEVTAGQYVVICVTDTGKGMTPEVIERAFEPFFTTKEIGRGTGLGLSQLFGFVKQSAGHVKIYSEVDEGTTVKIYLPRHRGDSTQAAVTATQEELPLGKREELILVVEDEARVRRMSVDVLVELGYSVIDATDANEALALLATHPNISLMFTDIVMPGMTGRVLADRARTERPDLKVLYTTGYTRNAIVHNGIVDYGVAFIQKPFTVATLARKIRDTLDGD